MVLTWMEDIHHAHAPSQIRSLRICTCNLIKPEWVLTAAHCLKIVHKYGMRAFKIVYGDLGIQANTTKYQRSIKKMIPHFGFAGNNIYIEFLPTIAKDNLALIMIDTIDNVEEGQISAVDYKSLIGYPVKLIGAGGTYSFSELFRGEIHLYAEKIKSDQLENLQIADAVVVKCDPKTPPFETLLAGVCVHSKCSKFQQGLITGDGGGPLLYKGKIVGVTAFYGPATEPLSRYDSAWSMNYKVNVGVTGSIYTAVSPYLEWINSVIEAEEKKCVKKRAKGKGKREDKDKPKQILI
ncbi:trypsin domain-containing protein [Phthorimaea operculella]|nr:trypsin domain-containing protein [Phthorimaea operculella]